MTTTLVIEIIALSATLLSFAGAAVWTVATVKNSVQSLTKSIDRLTERLDAIEHEQAATRERVARLEGAGFPTD